jgi:predicted HAD superfamily Cof-like phosphohydrolase
MNSIRPRPSYYEDVKTFHREVLGLAVGNQPYVVDDATFLFRLQFLQEEIQELIAAHRARDIVAVADALVDIAYVALGTALHYGIPFDAAWAEVHRANMEKRRAAGADESKRDDARDAVKPKGWRPPDLAAVLADARRVGGEPE